MSRRSSRETPQSSTPRTTVRRLPDRGVYDREVIFEILDEALVCHIGFLDGGQPFVMPTIHARIDDVLYVHGSRSSRMLHRLAEGRPACVTVSVLDGIVVARSAFHSSMNYRSVVALGAFREVTDEAEKMGALRAIVEHVIPGRWEDVRRPTDAEVQATTVLAMPLDEMSAKIRRGPPSDHEADMARPYWAGVVPLRMTPGPPIPDPALPPDIPVPAYLRTYARPQARGGG